MSRMRLSRTMALGILTALALAGSFYYWASLYPVPKLRDERHAMWENAAQWWLGMEGRLLTQHRTGIQTAELDPAAGRIRAVRDLWLDEPAAEQAMAAVQSGRWLIISVNGLGSEARIAALQARLQAAGWTGDFRTANDGSGIVVLTRGPDGRPSVLAAEVSAGKETRLDLPAGLKGADGKVLARPFSVLVREY